MAADSGSSVGMTYIVGTVIPANGAVAELILSVIPEFCKSKYPEPM